MYSQQAQRFANGGSPPLPHQPQPHFYGAPNLDFLAPAQAAGLKAGEKGYFCGFDSVASATSDSLEDTSVVITGYMGGLDVFEVSKRGLQRLASLSTLRGAVHNAKLLPKSLSGSDEHPVVAVVLHGPVWPSRNAADYDGDDIDSMLEDDASQGFPTGSPPQLGQSNPESITHYQTSVELYSLQTKKHLETLLALPKTRLTTPMNARMFEPPSPGGALSIHASNKTIAVASGVSGEIWTFGRNIHGEAASRFHCLGKVWTVVPNDISSPSAPVELDIARENLPKQSKKPLFSMSERWLAYSPPVASSQLSLGAIVPGLAPSAKVPGLSTRAPPHPQPITCAADVPDPESWVNRYAREGVQEAIKGAKWLGDQSYQAFRNYWNKPVNAQQPNGNARVPLGFGIEQFPPTHASGTKSNGTTESPTLISIVDMHRLPHPLVPLATFKVPGGCSFISFAPNGLMIYTASSKGDVQFVWDLMRLQKTSSSLAQGSILRGPQVRQIHKFTRVTVAKIVDVVWKQPHGERLAILTERGTVHIADLPASCLTWPPPRRQLRVTPSPVKPSNNEEPPSAAGTMRGFARGMLRNVPVGRPRRSSSSGPGLSQITAASIAAHIGQGLGAGVSRSFGAASGTLDHMRKVGEIRLHIPQASSLPERGSVKWLSCRHKEDIAVVGGGVVRLYTFKRQQSFKNPDKPREKVTRRHVELQLPDLVDRDAAELLGLGDDVDFTDKEAPDQKWSTVYALDSRSGYGDGTDMQIPNYEIESSAPFQPFHTDRRVGLYIYNTAESQSASPSVSALFGSGGTDKKDTSAEEAPINTPWAFGLPISGTKLNLGSTGSEDNESADGHRALPSSAIERVMSRVAESDGEEQIVVTTRRRKHSQYRSSDDAGAEDDEGFFEDDCEVLDFATQRV